MTSSALTQPEWLQTLIKNAGDGIHVINRQGDLLFASDRFWQMLGYDSFAEIEGMNILAWEAQYASEELGVIIERLFTQELDTTVTFETQHRRKNGEIFDVEVTVHPIIIQGEALMFASSREIGPRKTIENELKRYAVKLERLVAFNALLSEVNELIATVTDEAGFLERICGLIVRHTEATLTCISQPDDQGWFQTLAVDGPMAHEVEHMHSSIREDLPEGHNLLGMAWRRGQSFDLPSITQASSLTPWKEQATHLGLESGISLPIQRNGSLWGVLTVYYAERDLFNDDLRQILRDLSRSVGFGLEQIENRGIQQALINSSASVVLIVKDRIIQKINARAAKMLGYHPADLEGQPTRIIYIDEKEWQRVGELAYKRIDTTGETAIASVRLRHRSGQTRIGDFVGVRLDGREGWSVWTIEDVTERHHLAESLRKQAFTDDLTHLPNRRALDDELEKVMARTKRHDRLLAVVMLDLDDFKPINDSFGHVMGDQLLKAFTKRIRTVLRKTDYIARLGGDEFIVLLEDCSAMPEIMTVLHKIGAAARKPFVIKTAQLCQTVEIDLSAGVCLYPLHDTAGNPDALLRYADQALYESKTHKRDRLHFWTLYGESATKRLNPGQRLLHGGGLRVWYQPIMDNRTRKIVGIEALARLKDENQRILTPDLFLSQFTEDDLFELGRQVISRAITDLERLNIRLPESSVWLSVNIDPASITDAFIDYLDDILQTSTIAPNRLVLEILESSHFEHQQQAVRQLHALKKLGLRLALDDIGSAYSSLLRLKELPIDEIKLDQGFIRSLSDDPSGIFFAETVHDLATDLNVSMVVEGVENQAILDAMSILGIPLLQGYAIAKPMPFDALETFLRTAEVEPGVELPPAPVSWLGIYARHIAYDRLMRKTIKHDASMVNNAKLKYGDDCPFVEDLKRLGRVPSQIIDLHQAYHSAMAAVHQAILDCVHPVDWHPVAQAHEALLVALQALATQI